MIALHLSGVPWNFQSNFYGGMNKDKNSAQAEPWSNRDRRNVFNEFAYLSVFSGQCFFIDVRTSCIPTLTHFHSTASVCVKPLSLLMATELASFPFPSRFRSSGSFGTSFSLPSAFSKAGIREARASFVWGSANGSPRQHDCARRTHDVKSDVAAGRPYEG